MPALSSIFLKQTKTGTWQLCNNPKRHINQKPQLAVALECDTIYVCCCCCFCCCGATPL